MISQADTVTISNYGSIVIPRSMGYYNDTDTTKNDDDLEHSDRAQFRDEKSIISATKPSNIHSAWYPMLFVSSLLVIALLYAALPDTSMNKFFATWPQDEYYDSVQIGMIDAITYSPLRNNESITNRSSSKSNTTCTKSLILLRHAKSSWTNSPPIDDFDRTLSAKGRSVARTVGKSLKSMKVELPQIILASPSVRTIETLNLVLKEWVFDTGNKSMNDRVKGMTRYDMAWYDLSDEGYLDKLVEVLSHEDELRSSDTTMFGDLNRVMMVGHNPAMEHLLNDLVSSISNSFESTSWLHYRPGHVFELCFPTLTRWRDLGAHIMKRDTRGEIALHVPTENDEKMHQ